MESDKESISDFDPDCSELLLEESLTTFNIVTKSIGIGKIVEGNEDIVTKLVKTHEIKVDNDGNRNGKLDKKMLQMEKIVLKNGLHIQW